MTARLPTVPREPGRCAGCGAPTILAYCAACLPTTIREETDRQRSKRRRIDRLCRDSLHASTEYLLRRG